MKSYKKNSKIITVDQEEYCYVIKESVESITLKVYSTIFTSSYFEVVCNWMDYHDESFHSKENIELSIKYALENGWEPNHHNRKDIFLYNEVVGD